MRQCLMVLVVVGLVLAVSSPAAAAVHETFDFNTSWSGDYTPGWENSSYRHGPPPVGKMMEYVSGGHSGTGGLKLIADSTPESWMWWAAVNVARINPEAVTKAYDPWLSVRYYDEGYDTGATLQKVGQMFAVPSWVNPYIPPGEDWTDTQFGARFNQPPTNDQYYYVAAGEGSPGWQNTGVDRENGGWVQLKMQLSSTDGKIHYYLNGVEKGSSYRDDYIDLGTENGLYVMFDDPLSAWGTDKPYTIWDDYEFGSDYDGPAYIPEPASLIVWGLLAAAAVASVWWRKQKTA